MCSPSKEQSILSRKTIQTAFFSELCNFLNLENISHFVISPLLLKIFTYFEYAFTIQTAIHTIKGDNLKCIVFRSMPPFDLDFLSSIKHPTAEHWIRMWSSCLLFPQCFLSIPKQIKIFKVIFIL